MHQEDDTFCPIRPGYLPVSASVILPLVTEHTSFVYDMRDLGASDAFLNSPLPIQETVKCNHFTPPINLSKALP